jgi:GNAT superfamily N-acetyltransferase
MSRAEDLPLEAAVQEWHRGPFTVSTDRRRLDLDLVHGVLSREFWDARDVSRASLERAVRGSLCFGLHEGDRQVGFARVITDLATFAFLTDDFVVESHRGRGLASWLMECVLSHPDLRGLHRFLLVTRDPRLYRKAGFAPLQEPGEYMELVTPRPGGAAP